MAPKGAKEKLIMKKLFSVIVIISLLGAGVARCDLLLAEALKPVGLVILVAHISPSLSTRCPGEVAGAARATREPGRIGSP